MKIYDKAAVVLPVGLNANRSARSSLGIALKKNFLTKSLSNTLDRIGVTEIGLKSPRSRGVLTFGMGVTMLCFQDIVQVDSAKIKLSIFVTMGVISNAHSLKNQ